MVRQRWCTVVRQWYCGEAEVVYCGEAMVGYSGECEALVQYCGWTVVCSCGRHGNWPRIRGFPLEKKMSAPQNKTVRSN